MASLSTSLKSFVVTELACFASPSAVRDALEKRGVSVTLDQIVYYDPTTRSKKKPAKKWVELFHETREDYRRGAAAVAIANQRWRLEQMQAIHDATQNPKLRLETMERAAKEVGGGYTNTHKHRLTGKDDDTPIRSETEARVVVLPDNGRGDRAPGARAASGRQLNGDREPKDG